MSHDAGNAPSWLFSFVDLAFLLLIAMTQLASEPGAPDLGEIVVPRIHADAERDALPERADQRWQVRVHPPGPHPAPFELRRSDADAAGAGVERLDADALARALAGLRADRVPEPLLAPHSDARTEDTLDAVALLEAHWPGRRRALVSGRLAQR